MALDRLTGQPVWTHVTGGPVEAPPLVAGGLVVVGSRDGHLRAFDAATGAVRWDADLGAEITAGAALVPAVGERTAGVLVGAYDGRVHHLDLATGASRWVYATGSYIYGSAAVLADRAVVGGCDGFVHVVALEDGRGLVRVPVEAYVGAAVAVDGRTGYVGHFGNVVMAFDVFDGTIHWTYRDRSFPYLSSPALIDEVVILGGRDKQVHGIDRATGQPAWWFPTRGKVDGSPVVVGKHVLVGSADGRLYVLTTDGEAVRELDLGAAISATPAVAGGWVYVGAEDGALHAFGPPPKKTPPRKR